MLDYLKKRPMMISAFAASEASVLLYYFEGLSVIAGVFVIIVFFAALYLRLGPGILFSVFMVLMVIISIIRTNEKISYYERLGGISYTGRCVVTENPVDREGYSTAIIESSDCEGLPDGIKIFAFYTDRKLKIGDYIDVTLETSSLENSEFKTSNYAENIYLSAKLKDISVIEYDRDFVLSIDSRIQRYISNTINRYLKSDEAATIEALTIGNRDGFSDEFYGNVKAAGVSHVMVVSGMHLAIIMSFLFSVIEKFFYNRSVRAILGFICVIFMMAVCGFTMSIIRAGVMYMLFSAALILRRDSDAQSILAAALTLILLVSPFSIFSISLQLSVLSTYGILVVCPYVKKRMEGRLRRSYEDGELRPFDTLKLSICNILTASLSAMILTTPVTVYIYGSISVVAVLANILISSAVSVVLVLSIIAITLSLIYPPLSQPLFIAAGVVTKYINFVINRLGSLPFAVVEFSRLMTVAAVIAIILLFWWRISCKKRADMLKLEKTYEKIKKEGGGRLKWR